MDNRTESEANSDDVTGNVSGDHSPLIPPRRSRCYLCMLTTLAAMGGFLYGYDTGVMSGALLQLRQVFDLPTFYQELIVTITVAAAAVFSVLAGFANRAFGRRPVIIVASFVFAVGSVIQGAAYSREALVVGRLIVGTGIGFVSMTVPVYLAECAPTHLRGILLVTNNLCIAAGQFVSSLVDAAFSYDRETGWRYMLGLAAVPAVIQFIGFLFLPETPRWLVSKGNMKKAIEVLMLLRGHPHVEEEAEQIRRTLAEDRGRLVESGQGDSALIVQVFSSAHVRRALVIGCGMHLVQQAVGINTIMYYTGSIVESTGMQDFHKILWLSSLIVVNNFIFSFVGLPLVERIGRRRLTLFSLGGVVISLAVIASGFQIQQKFSPAVTELGNSTVCNQYRDCFMCASDPSCGYCRTSSLMLNATCELVSTQNVSDPYAILGAQSGPCTRDSLKKHPYYLWTTTFCPTEYQWIVIMGLVLYLLCFAPGMGPMPWTVNSEIYPLWARSTAVSIATTVHWILNIITSMTFLSLIHGITAAGAFWLYTGMGTMGFLFLFFLQPETKGRTLEEMEDLFMQPWCSERTAPNN